MNFQLITNKANLTAAGVLMRDYPESPSAIVTICPFDEAEYHATEDLSNLDPDTDLCPSGYTFHARAEFGQFIPAAEAIL